MKLDTSQRLSECIAERLCTKSHSACEAGVSIKPGAQAPGSDHKRQAGAREDGRQREIQSFARCRGLRPFYLAR